MRDPCRGCPDRVPDPNCHSTCERYLSLRAENEKRYALRRALSDVRSARDEAVLKQQRKWIMKRKRSGK